VVGLVDCAGGGGGAAEARRVEVDCCADCEAVDVAIVGDCEVLPTIALDDCGAGAVAAPRRAGARAAPIASLMKALSMESARRPTLHISCSPAGTVKAAQVALSVSGTPLVNVLGRAAGESLRTSIRLTTRGLYPCQQAH